MSPEGGPSARATARLRARLAAGRTLVAPGVYDGLSARLAERAGFEVLYASGGAIARGSGYPDLGLLTATEMQARLEQLVDVTDVPIVADADTGYGNELNVHRAMRACERLGVAGVHLEDQSFPKRCGHLDDKSLVPMEQMCLKLRVARQAVADPDFLLIARTDAIAVEGLDAALRRAEAYAGAGADMLFVEAPRSEAEIEAIARHLPGPKLINMFLGGKTPLVPLERLQALGFALVIVPSDLQRAAIAAMERTLAAIGRDGDSRAVAGEMASFAEREDIVGTERWLALGRADGGRE